MTKLSKHWVLLGLGVMVVLYIGNWLLTPLVVRPTVLEVLTRQRGRQPLDSNIWKAGSLSKERYAMANYVVSLGLIGNADAREVQAVLGDPDYKLRNSPPGAFSWVYIVARQRDVPARTALLWPGLAGNCERWALRVVFRGNEEYVIRTEICVP